MSAGIAMAERGLVPDGLIRAGIRKLLRRRLREETERFADGGESYRAFIEKLRESPIAVETDRANEQHYEIPARFFQRVLGRRLKYSGCYWPPGVETLDAAEEAMLDLTCERAGLEEGQEVLELGCGWGAVTIRMAERYRSSQFLAVSNSASQKQFIDSRTAALGLHNVRVVTSDVAEFEPGRRFDRVVSVEMFEHLRNPGRLLDRIAGWLVEDGRLFVHVFCHRQHTYLFETEGDHNWMGRHFFTGGMMPGADLYPEMATRLALEKRWTVSGEHYARTAEAWLANLDEHRGEILAMFTEIYGPRAARSWLHRWRIFFLSCAELFGFAGGEEWQVSHYRFAPR